LLIGGFVVLTSLCLGIAAIGRHASRKQLRRIEEMENASEDFEN